MTAFRNLWKTLKSPDFLFLAVIAAFVATGASLVEAQTPYGGVDPMSASTVVRGAPVNNTSAPITTAAAATVKIISAPPSPQKTTVVMMSLMSAGTSNVTFEYGTGTLCGTGTVLLTGAYPMIAGSILSFPIGVSFMWLVPPGNDVCMVNSAAIQESGFVTYNQY